jgi:hypothetical protein
MSPGSGDRGSWLQGSGNRRGEDLSRWLEAWHHAWTAGDDPTAQRDRASHRSDEDGWQLNRNWLKGALGDAMHAVLCGVGHNQRMIVRKLLFFTPSYWPCARPRPIACDSSN